MSARIFISVADRSADQHAARLIQALRQLDGSALIEGFGGELMAQVGAVIHRETVSGAAMGLHGLKRARLVASLLDWLRGHYRKTPADLHICIDSSGMNLPMAEVAHRAGVPVFYYIAPQLWASRPWRLRHVKRSVDRLACILPFERDWYRRRGVRADFVGHPLFDSLPTDRSRPARDAAAPRRLCLVPGSRRAEVREHLPRMLEVLRRLRQAMPDLEASIPTTSAVHELVTAQTVETAKLTVRLEGFDDLVREADLCLCKSGTSTLQCAAWGTPMIVVYYAHPLLWRVLAPLLIRTRHISLVNILAGRELAPEVVPWHGPVDAVVDLAYRYLTEPELGREQSRQLREMVSSLDGLGAAARTAQLAMEMIRERNGAR